MIGITGYGAYVPRKRLQRQAVVEAIAWFNPAIKGYATGERSMCNWDEDALTMAVEASRDCLGPAARDDIKAVFLASTSLPFKDRQNSGVLATALNLGENIMSMDVTSSQRAGTTALINALNHAKGVGETTLYAASEKRRTKAANVQELLYGDAAAAFTLGSDDPIAEFVGAYQVATDFVDHYKGEGEEFDYHWEERWIRDEGYMKLVPQALEGLAKETGVSPDAVDQFIMPCVIRRVGGMVAKRCGLKDDAVRDNLHGMLGEAGTAHALVMLAHALEEAEPGQTIIVAGFAQGCDALMFRTTEAIKTKRPQMGVSGFLARRIEESNYNKYLAFNDLMILDHGLRAELDKQTALTALYRNKEMLIGMMGGQCRQCGTVQFPKSKVCVNPNCGAFHSQDDHPFADAKAKVQSWTADNLTYAVEPPQHFGMIVFDEGGRLMSDITDVDVGEVEVGTPVRMMFRIKDYDSQRGFTRYFWKAAPDFTQAR
ncbi:MAG: OB-fold domain-containing protein [Alphaproteobacteria bacterium]|jgi:3-hydroxy-3-methylglutaryl CoA synthase|nr:OB-fold domain-containing protein [Alphaproteobacteria bacterium]